MTKLIAQFWYFLFYESKKKHEEMVIPVNKQTQPMLEGFLLLVEEKTKYGMGKKMSRARMAQLWGPRLAAQLMFILLFCALAGAQLPACPATHQVQRVDLDTQQVIDAPYAACVCEVASDPSQSAVSCVQPTPTPTPTPVPTPSPTPTPLPSPTPTPTPVPSPTPSALTTVTFDPGPGTCCSVNGVFKGIDWGTSQWAWEGQFLGFHSNNFYFFNSTGNNRSFTFVNPSILLKVDLLTDLPGTLTIKSYSDAAGTLLLETATTQVATGTPFTFSTNWTKPAKKVTFTFVTSDGQGWHVDFDNLVYQ